MRKLVLSASTIAALGVLAVLPGAAAQAAPAGHAAPAQPAATAAGTCPASTLSIPFETTIPTATKPFEAVVQKETVRNTTRSTVRKILFDFELVAPGHVAHPGPTPRMWWRRGTTGAWRALPLPYWTPAPAGHPDEQGYWETNDTSIGLIVARGTARIQFRASFGKRDHAGIYSGIVTYLAPRCDNGHEPIGTDEADFAYRP